MNWNGEGFVEWLNKTYEWIVQAVKRIENIEIGHKSFVTENHWNNDDEGHKLS